MKLKEIAKRLVVFAAAAVVIVSGSALPVDAASKDKSRDSVELPQLIQVDQRQVSGGITPTVFRDAYKRADELQYRSRTQAPPKYCNLSKLGKSTTVKNQDPWNTCWAFGSLSSLESNQLKGNTGSGAETDPDYSERQLAWFAYEPQTAESIKVSAAVSDQTGEGCSAAEPRLNRGGNMPQATAVLSTWQGAATEEQIPYQNQAGSLDAKGVWEVAAQDRNLSAVHLQNADFLPSPATFNKYDSSGLPSEDAVYTYDEAATDAMKAAIMNNGAVAIAYYADQSTPEGGTNSDYFNYDEYCQYVNVLNQETVQNHGVSIVGWNDDYPSTNFREGVQPEGNGAWIVKNSWGADWGINGYFFLSYYDRTIDQVTSFQGEPTDNYDNIYQYDYLGLASALQFGASDSKSEIANVFTAKGNEEIQAVSAVTPAPNSTVSVKIYKIPDGAVEPVPAGAELIAEQSEQIGFSGYHTIKLDAPAELAAGEKFSIVQEIKGGDQDWYTPIEVGADAASQKAVCCKGESYLIEGDVIEDMAEKSGEGITFGNAMIKAFTKDVVAESEAPAVKAFKYQAYDNMDTDLGSDTINVAAESSGITNIPLPEATSYIKITEVTLTDQADPDTQVAVTVNGNAYTLGDKIARTDFMKTGDDRPIVFTTKSVPRGTNTRSWGFDFAPDLFTLSADSGRVVVSDSNAYLPKNTVLTAEDVTTGGDFDKVKDALEPYGAAEQFYLYRLALTPGLKEGEQVNLEITPKSGYDKDERTKLYYVDTHSGSMVLTEVADLASKSGALRADVSEMGYYVVARVKEAPEVPTFNAITYSKARTLADISFPTAEGGSWSWDAPATVPDVKTGAYAATFTPTADSQYRTYKAEIALSVKKATPVVVNTQTGTLTYGEPLSKVTPKATVKEKDNNTEVEGTSSWTDGTICSKVSDSMNTRYTFTFYPTDRDNYECVDSNAVIVVNPKSIAVKVADANKTYGDENPPFKIEPLADGVLVGADTVTDLQLKFRCNADKATNAGNTIKIDAETKNDNYKLTVTEGTLTIDKRPIGFKVKDVTVKYGENLPTAYAFEVTNLVNGATQESVGAAADIEPQNVPSGNLYGRYVLKLTNSAVTDSNYVASGKMINGTLTIEPAEAKGVKNDSGLPGALASRFGMLGNLNGNEVLHIGDMNDEGVLRIFKSMLKDGQKLQHVFDLNGKKADGSDLDLTGGLILNIPFDTEYHGKQVAVYHYVKAGERNAENIPVDVDTVDVYENLTVADGKVQITVYSMSPFATVVPEDAQVSPDPGAGQDNMTPTVNSQEVSKVKTGDRGLAKIVILFGAAAAAVIVALIVSMVRKRRKCQE